MSTRPRTRPASQPAPAEAPAGAAGRNIWIAVVLGLTLGQVGYVYTRQTNRFLVSMLLGTLALSLAFGAALHQFPGMFDTGALLDDPLAWQQNLLAAMGVPTAVALLNNLVCAVDLFLQVRARR